MVSLWAVVVGVGVVGVVVGGASTCDMSQWCCAMDVSSLSSREYDRDSEEVEVYILNIMVWHGLY